MLCLCRFVTEDNRACIWLCNSKEPHAAFLSVRFFFLCDDLTVGWSFISPFPVLSCTCTVHLHAHTNLQYLLYEMVRMQKHSSAIIPLLAPVGKTIPPFSRSKLFSFLSPSVYSVCQSGHSLASLFPILLVLQSRRRSWNGWWHSFLSSLLILGFF